jgi:hypothetical protein
MNLFLRYGAIAGGVLAVAMFGPYFVFGAKPEWMEVGQIVGYTSMVLCLTATIFAMRHERARSPTRPSWHRLFGVGIGVSAVAAAIFGTATWAFYALAGDALPQALYEFYVNGVRNSGAPAESIATQLAELERMKPIFWNRPLQAVVMFATVFLIGAVESAIGAWFVNRPAASRR